MPNVGGQKEGGEKKKRTCSILKRPWWSELAGRNDWERTTKRIGFIDLVRRTERQLAFEESGIGMHVPCGELGRGQVKLLGGITRSGQ